MIKVGLISDTHGYFDPEISKYFADCDEIWHAGDFGTLKVAEKLEETAPVIGVYGNVDGPSIRKRYPENQRFEKEGVDIWMKHIGGSYKRYCVPIREKLEKNPPDVFICGHSHNLKIGRDDENNNMLFVNPGAAGKQGFHKVRTCVRFELDNGNIQNMEVIELGDR